MSTSNDGFVARLVAEREEYKRRIDKVMALVEKVESEMVHTKAFYSERAYGAVEAYRAVKSLLAPKQEARFEAIAYVGGGWVVREISNKHARVFFYGSWPDAEKLARECCDRLNNGASDE